MRLKYESLTASGSREKFLLPAFVFLDKRDEATARGFGFGFGWWHWAFEVSVIW